MTLLVRTLLRVAVLSLVFVAGLVVIDASDTTDALGPGLILFLVLGVIAMIWAIVDARSDVKQSLLVWLIAAAGTGLVLALASVVMDGTDAADAGILGAVIFTVALVYPPALLGIGIGSVLGRTRV